MLARNLKLNPLGALLLASLVLFAALGSACSSDGDSGSDAGLRIGALLPLTGALGSYGETSKAALDDAVASMNLNGRTSVTLVVEDTRTDPPTALEKLKSLKDRGLKLVIGPYASSEVKAVIDYANQNGIILISPLSTARTLAIPDDNVLRFTPDDEQEGLAMAAVAWANGTRIIVPVTRDDEGNQGLQSAMRVHFEKLGGRFLAPIAYPPNETDFKDEATAIDNAVRVAGGRQAGVGIYLTAFDEVTGLFGATAAIPALAELPWYGSDSVALSKGLVENTTAAAFAARAVYPNPILGLRDSDRGAWGPVSERVAAKLGRQPDAFALAAYDALKVGHAAMTAAGARADATALRQQVIDKAADYTGLTGPTVLNPAGDRALGNYDFWSVCRSGSGFTWQRSYTYIAAAGGTAGRVDKMPPC